MSVGTFRKADAETVRSERSLVGAPPVKDQKGRRQDRAGKVFRPSCRPDTYESKVGKKQEQTSRASDHVADVSKSRPTQSGALGQRRLHLRIVHWTEMAWS